MLIGNTSTPAISNPIGTMMKSGESVLLRYARAIAAGEGGSCGGRLYEMPPGAQDETAQRGGRAACSLRPMRNVFLTRCELGSGMSTISTSAALPTTDVTLIGPSETAGNGTTGMFPERHCFFVSPSRSTGSTTGQARSGWLRSTAAVTKRRTDERSWRRSVAESCREASACSDLYCPGGAGLTDP